jgi:hypothetical protein
MPRGRKSSTAPRRFREKEEKGMATETAGGADRHWLQTSKDLLSMIRDGLLLLILVVLLFFPGMLNHVLTTAGITKADILGFEWQKELEAAIEETAESKEQVKALETQLLTLSDGVEELGRQPDPNARANAVRRLTTDIRKSHATAERVRADLGKTQARQNAIKSRTVPPR